MKRYHDVSAIEDAKSRRNRLFFDRRIKSIRNCQSCDYPVSEKEFKKNHGICNKCKHEKSDGS